MSEDVSFWAFMELCGLRGELCPEDYEKVQAFIKKWYRKETDFSRWRYDLNFTLFDMEEWWKYRPAKPSDIFGIFGLMMPLVTELPQYLKIEELPNSSLKETK